MRTNDKGVALIKRWEGLRLEAYRCPAKILTIGYGHTGDVNEGSVITEAEADELLRKDLARFERGVEAIVGLHPTNQDQFSAFVSFTFNLGLHALLKSTLLKRHKARDYQAAADQFREWNKARVNGQLVPLAGLTARREAERKLYLGEA
jgi:lysozyme